MESALDIAVIRAIQDAHNGGAARLPEWSENRLVWLFCQHMRRVTSPSQTTSFDLKPYLDTYWDAVADLDEDDLLQEDIYDDLQIIWDQNKIRHPKGNALASAIEIANHIPPPKDLKDLPPQLQHLAHVCRILADASPDHTFFMSQRMAAQIIGRTKPRGAAALRKLIKCGKITPLPASSNHQRAATLFLA